MSEVEYKIRADITAQQRADELANELAEMFKDDELIKGRRSLTALQNLEKYPNHMDFTDCNLTKAHLLRICAILSITNRGQNLGLLLGGNQDFSKEAGEEIIIEMLQRNPNAVYTLHLPSFLAESKSIHNAWKRSRELESERTGYEENAARICAADNPNLTMNKWRNDGMVGAYPLVYLYPMASSNEKPASVAAPTVAPTKP